MEISYQKAIIDLLADILSNQIRLKLFTLKLTDKLNY